MERLTKDDVKLMGMVDLAHNHVFVKNHEAWYRDFGTEISVRELITRICTYNSIACPTNDEDFDEFMFNSLEDNCESTLGIIAMYYNTLWGFAEVREKLKAYEDLEEQGLLHIAPVAEGTEIYIPFSGLDEMDLEDGISKTTYMYGQIEFEYGEMNKDWFLTQEEAEKALENERLGKNK